jgi:hypothetical protein
LLLGKEILLRKAAEPAPATAGEPGDETEATPEEGEAAAGAVDQAKEQAAKVTSKAQDFLADNQEKIEKLESRLVQIGLVSIALGIIHLFFGGIWLF